MSEERTYFYLCGYPLEPGSMVHPGNWGRICRLRRESHVDRFLLLLKEMVFESVGGKHVSSLPSRLAASFVFEIAGDLHPLSKTLLSLGWESSAAA